MADTRRRKGLDLDKDGSAIEPNQAALQEVCWRHSTASLSVRSGIEAAPLGVAKVGFGAEGTCCFKENSQSLLIFSTP